MGFYDNIDLLWDTNGDFQATETGDLASTENDYLTAFVQQIRSLVEASTGDWQSLLAYAADLDEYIGQPNTREVGMAIESRIRGALIMNYVANSDDVYVRVVPVRPDVVLIVLVLNVVATENNSMYGPGDTMLALMLNLPSGELVNVNPQKVVNYFPVRG